MPLRREVVRESRCSVRDRGHSANSERAAVVVGVEFAGNLQPPDFGDLTANADSATVRKQVGQLIGIGENLHTLHTPAQEGTLAANLGYALLMCLQSQSEIGNRGRLSHRQDEIWIKQALTGRLVQVRVEVR